MDIIFKGRRTGLQERFRRHATAKLTKIEKLDQKAIRVDVEVSQERNPRQSDRRERVELTIRSRGPVIRAEAAADDRFVALDRAVAKLEARLRRVGDRRKDRHGGQTMPDVSHLPDQLDEQLSGFPAIAADGSLLAGGSLPAGGNLPADGAPPSDEASLGDAALAAGADEAGAGEALRAGGAGEALRAREALRAGGAGGALRAGGARSSDGMSLPRDDAPLEAPPGQVWDGHGGQPRSGDFVPIAMEGDGPLVVREKFHAAASMTIDQALLEMELVGHDFYLFRDQGCGLPSVVYRRCGYDYGVIRLVEEPAREIAPAETGGAVRQRDRGVKENRAAG